MPVTENQRKFEVSKLPRWLLGILPLVLLGVALWLFVELDPMESLTADQPPVEQLAIQRVELEPLLITLHVVNGGRVPVTVAQVQVDEAYWAYEIEPDNTIPRLGRATITIPYHWVPGAAHHVRILSSTGTPFEHTIEVAATTPQPSATSWAILALIGFFIGVVPVGLGLMWFPLLRQLSAAAIQFVLALTVGLLIFLLVDTVLEGIEIAQGVPDVFQAVPLVFFAGMLSFLALVAVGKSGAREEGVSTGAHKPLWIATAIAIGIGLHNLGEGMVVGASIAAGEAALGSFLIIGFVLHNLTEGIGIGAPMANSRPSTLRLVVLTLIAGVPAIIGAWIGGFLYMPLLAVLFFAIGAGAILQVVFEVGKLLVREREEAMTSWVAIGGVAAGIGIMYATALLV